TVVEPGPLARKLLAARLAPLQIYTTFHSQRLNFEDPSFLSSVPLGTGLTLQDHGILFANVLGQVRVGSVARWGASLRRALEGLNWASYHDRFSAPEPLWQVPDGEFPRILPTSELIREPDLRRSRAPAPLEVQEHLVS